MVRKLSFVVSVIFVFVFTFPPFCSAKGYKFSGLLCQSFETDRLVLRPQSESDFCVLADYLLDKDVTKFLDPTLENGFETRQEALQFLKSGASSEITNSLNLTVILKSSGLPIGILSVMLFGDEAMFGYWLGKDFWSHGYASEACLAICGKVFNADDVRCVSIYCHSENKSSYKLGCKILDYLEKNNSESFELIRSETSSTLTYNSHEFVMKGLILQKASDCP